MLSWIEKTWLGKKLGNNQGSTADSDTLTAEHEAIAQLHQCEQAQAKHRPNVRPLSMWQAEYDTEWNSYYDLLKENPLETPYNHDKMLMVVTEAMAMTTDTVVGTVSIDEMRSDRTMHNIVRCPQYLDSLIRDAFWQMCNRQPTEPPELLWLQWYNQNVSGEVFRHSVDMVLRRIERAINNGHATLTTECGCMRSAAQRCRPKDPDHMVAHLIAKIDKTVGKDGYALLWLKTRVGRLWEME